jgi:hypothetical protein
MRHSVLLSLVLAAACTRAGDPPTPEQPSQNPGAAPIPKTAPAPKPAAATRVELSSVTLADDCGGTPPGSAPAKTALKAEESEAKAKSKSKQDSAYAPTLAKRRCEQTSMQLTVIAGDASSLHVKSVELFDEAGKSLGTLTATKPTRWSSTTMTYEGWYATATASTESSVSYVLSQPKWDHIADRWNKTYTLKTVLTVGGVDQPAQKDVTLTAPTSLPPNVKT